METNFITFTTEISELKLNKLTNSYYFNFKYNISDNEYLTADLTGYNQYQAEGIRKDFIDMISNMNKIAVDLSEKIKNGDILNTSHNIKLEGQKPVNNIKDYSDFNCIQLYINNGEYYDLYKGLIDEDSVEVILVGDNSHLEKGLNYKIDCSGLLEVLSIEEQNKNNSEYIFLNGTVRVYFKTIPTQIIRASQAEDKALSQTVIDYLSKQKGVDNKGVKGESIFFEDNKRLQIDITEMKSDIYGFTEHYYFSLCINDCECDTPIFQKKEEALRYKKTFINKIHEDYSLIKFLVEDDCDLLFEYFQYIHIKGANKDIYDYYKEETQKQYKILELTDTQHEARERNITVAELKQQINKLSEKNKKLKSKNRKLKKQLTTGE